MELPKTASGSVEADAPQRGGLALVGGHVHDFAGDDALGDAHLGGQNALFGNAEIAHALGDHPFVGGADGPNLDAGLAQRGDQRKPSQGKMRARTNSLT